LYAPPARNLTAQFTRDVLSGSKFTSFVYLIFWRKEIIETSRGPEGYTDP